MSMLKGTVAAVMAAGFALALGAAQAAAQALPMPRIAGEVASNSVELVWSKKGKGAHCTTPKKACTFEDGKPRPLGAACICKSQPKVKGKVTP